MAEKKELSSVAAECLTLDLFRPSSMESSFGILNAAKDGSIFECIQKWKGLSRTLVLTFVAELSSMA